MNRKVGLVPLSGLVLATALALTGCSTSSTSVPASSATPTSHSTSSATGKKTANDHATVKAPSILDNWSYPTRYVTLTTKYGYDTHKAVNKQKFPVFQIGSLGSKTIWPDSVRDPMNDKSPEEVVAHVLAEPDYCAHIAVGLYNTTWVTPSGAVIVVKTDNPWLKKWFPTDISKVNDWATAAMAGDSQYQLRTAKKCALVGALLEQLTNEGIKTLTTSLNYHIATESADTIYAANPFATIREFTLNPYQYTGEFLVLEFQLKGWPSNCNNQILINTGDGRFARPNCTPPTTTPPTTTPTPPPPPHATTPLCKSGETLTWWPNGTHTCKSSPLTDPSKQGHVPAGGAGKAPAQTDKVGPPAAGNPPTVYTVPPAPAAGTPVGTTTTPGTTSGTNEGGAGLN